ncbi:Transcription elongation factor, GreA/GreB family [Saccharopolyspora kobensis]|uniref:Transcription elongation factor, GreA/GreB family n=1 Tax=Saccharopolyspora kobensis TaxID=146035 RepID=A0A1H5ZRM1_9PSEU|nr:GreA/GreB family elongation factor [Saccharopolyspora kobensis]SEG39138.1 Transcription elongation factor, GreA/GreB family [Saccharopolyspora kobensis]SFE13130.1 Transcription elongation factor, GreA/GreB family [Saccharopolyspora kobensis]
MAEQLPERARAQLEAELTTLRERRRSLAAAMQEQESDVGDRGDEANALESGDDLIAVDERIATVTELLAGGPERAPGRVPDGTRATLRFDDGTEQEVCAVAIPEEIASGQQGMTVTTDSPLGRALAGRREGDTISYSTPAGEVRARVVSLNFPGD